MSAVEFLVEHCFHTLGGTLMGVISPLHRLAAIMYLHGPSVDVGQVKLGFWQGRDPMDICSSLTGVRSDLWRANEDACLQILAERFFAVYYMFYAFFAFWVMYWLLWYGMSLLWRCFSCSLMRD
jgi:hypothetical protein